MSISSNHIDYAIHQGYFVKRNRIFKKKLYFDKETFLGVVYTGGYHMVGVVYTGGYHMAGVVYTGGYHLGVFTKFAQKQIFCLLPWK